MPRHPDLTIIDKNIILFVINGKIYPIVGLIAANYPLGLLSSSKSTVIFHIFARR
jgi:hypothetical protein